VVREAAVLEYLAKEERVEERREIFLLRCIDII
jgi:hypothetical protein